MEDCVEDSSKVWKNAKSFLGWSSGGPPTKLMQDGKLYTKPGDLNKLMNEFFIKKVKDLRDNIPLNIGDPLQLVRKLFLLVTLVCRGA